jgi:hypothetical protein
MNAILARQIKRKLLRELFRRRLIQYFSDKGYEQSFDMPLFPPVIADLALKVQELFTKVEVQPFVEEVDQISNYVRVGWNLYVLGTNRLYLGSSSHSSMADLRMSIGGTVNHDMPVEYTTTPAEVIDFILKILDQSRTGYTELPKTFRLPLGVDQMIIPGQNWPNFFGRPVPGAYIGK